MVANSLPPTAQVGGAVIKQPRLPLPPIQIPNTAPPIITTAPPKKTSHTDKKPVDTDRNEVDNMLQRYTPVDKLVDNNNTSACNDHDNNNSREDITAGTGQLASGEELTSSLSPIKSTEDISVTLPEVDTCAQVKSPVTTKSLNKTVKHKKKLLSSTLSSPPLLDCSSKDDHTPAAGVLTNGPQDDLMLPALKGKNAKLSSHFDVVSSLTGQKR